MLPPSLGCGESYEFVYVSDSSVHQKCSNYTLTNLLFGLCKFMWIVDPLVILSSPHPGASTCPSYPRNVVSKKVYPTPSIVFTFGFTFEYFKKCGGASPLVLYHFFLAGCFRWRHSPCKCAFGVGGMFRLFLGSYFDVLHKNLPICFVCYCLS